MTEEFIEIVTANIADIQRAVVEQSRLETYMKTYMDTTQLEMSCHVRSSLIYALDTLSAIVGDGGAA